MNFGFQLFSLLMIFLLVIVYYAKKESFTKGNKIFRGILLVAYIMQLCNSAIYIVGENGEMSLVFSKVYLITVMFWFALFALYYVVAWLKDKYQQDNNKFKTVVNRLVLVFAGIQVMGIISVLIEPVSYINGMINFNCHVVSIFVSFYLLVDILVLLMGIKKIDQVSWVHLVVIFLVQSGAFFLQGRSLEIPFLIIGMIFTTFYSYFMLESMEKEEIKRLKLERDYALEQSIDKSEFLKVLSHEIRTPLNTIDGFGQVILDSDNIDEIKGDAKDIRAASRDLIDVINGMIDLSILESGKLEIINENYNVYDMFDDIVKITESKLRDKEVEFKTIVDEDIPEVLLGDSERISQVILNLLTNAIKYTDKGSIEIEVKSVKVNSRCRLKISVKDTGRGIKKEDLVTIFEGKERREGTTLGLAVSKYLIELMEGSIEVDSTYGKGSTFTVTIDQKIISERQEDKVSRKKVIKPFLAEDKRILLVDDNKLNLKVAVKMLEPYGVTVIEANSGQECLEVLEHDTDFDLILMDDLMPEMSGTECLDILRKIERVDGYYIPVVVLTANAVSGMKEKYINAGFEDYLAKPIDKYELDRILKKYLKGKK